MCKKEANTHSNLKKLAVLKKIYLVRKQERVGGCKEIFAKMKMLETFRENGNVWDYALNFREIKSFHKFNKIDEILRKIKMDFRFNHAL